MAIPLPDLFLPIVNGSGNGSNENTAIPYDNKVFPSGITDADGYYTIYNIPSQEYHLQVDMPGVSFSPEYREIDASTTGSQNFDLFMRDPIITPETVVLTELSNQYLDANSFDGETFYFTQMTTELEEVDAGDIIVSDVTSVAPDGYFRKVSDVTIQGSTMILKTIPATLEESIEDGTSFLKESLRPDQIMHSETLEGVTLVESDVKSPLTFKFEINAVFFDLDGDLLTKDDQVKVQGSIEFEMEFIFYLDMHGFSVKRFSLTNENSLTDKLKFSSEIELYSFDKEVILKSMLFSPIRFMVGPVPIVFLPKLDLVVGVDGSVKAGLSFEGSHEFSMRTGVEYRDSSGWNTIAEVSNKYDSKPPHVTFELKMKAYNRANFNLYLYGLAGPFVKIGPFLEIKVEPLKEPWWTLSAGLEVPVGFRVRSQKLLKIGEYEAVSIKIETNIAEAPPIVPTPTTVPTSTAVPTPTVSPTPPVVPTPTVSPTPPVVPGGMVFVP
ncbi:MAG: hypothetical protein KBA03_04865, partial [Anaerolineaceae bacterium]|nr:hypothetical protein [Anaerolineaceae bacterium]